MQANAKRQIQMHLKKMIYRIYLQKSYKLFNYPFICASTYELRFGLVEIFKF